MPGQGRHDKPVGSDRWHQAFGLQPVNPAGIKQKAVEAARLGASPAAIENPLTAQHDFLLLGEGWIEGNAVADGYD